MLDGEGVKQGLEDGELGLEGGELGGAQGGAVGGIGCGEGGAILEGGEAHASACRHFYI